MNDYADFSHVNRSTYYEVTSPMGRKRLETLSLDDAKLFVKKAWDKYGELLSITEVNR